MRSGRAAAEHALLASGHCSLVHALFMTGAAVVQVIRTIRHNTMFYCATIHPNPAKQNVLLAGAADKRVYQFDLATGDMVQVR